uniref:Uncharacterized protein n=1 Tax=Aegilops tauschii subsp. strangulata TaxID=200361 RepID=A0A453JJA6_AEGTS
MILMKTQTLKYLFRIPGKLNYTELMTAQRSLWKLIACLAMRCFLGLTTHFVSVPKINYPALKGNHAYFTDDQQYNQGRKTSRRDIGVVAFGNYNSKEDLVSPQLWSNWPSPVWITPSLTVMKLPPNDRWLSGPLCGLPKIEEGTLRGLFANLGIPISIGPTGMLQCLKSRSPRRSPRHAGGRARCLGPKLLKTMYSRI